MKAWIKSLFNKQLPEPNFLCELDKNKEDINYLIELAKRLDEMETDIRRHEKFLETVVNSWDTPMWVKEVNGRFLFVNIACAKIILRTTVTEALNLTDSDFEKNALAQVCIESDRVVAETLKVTRFIEHAEYDNYTLWLDVIKTPLIIDNKLVGIIGTAKNITNIVSKEIKDKFAKPAAIEIDLHSILCMNGDKGKQCNDLEEALERNNNG